MHKALSALTLTGLSLGALAVSEPAAAHHSFALFDITKTVSLQGTVKQFDWTNPHSWIKLDVVGPQAGEWMIELPAAAALARQGLTKNFLKVGDKVILRVNPLKDGGKGGIIESFAQQTGGAP